MPFITGPRFMQWSFSSWACMLCFCLYIYIRPLLLFSVVHLAILPTGKNKSQNKGLVSADRSTKVTLPRTTPRSNLSRLQKIYPPDNSTLQSARKQDRLFRPTCRCTQIWLRGRGPIFVRLNTGEVNIVTSSMDSDLEAFSHNPADGSLAPLSFRAGAITNYPNQRFLSY